MSKNKKIVNYTRILCILAVVVLLGVGIQSFLFSKGDTPSIFARITHNVETENYDVDLVYLWCDGNEPAFWERKNYWLKQENRPAMQAVADGRWEQVDELKYSLRSVEKYLPWIHHIYVVTDRQVPMWLKTDNPKLTVVDHSEIIPEKYIPVFNSSAIETSIYKIPGLAEHFLLANDDTFVNRSLKKSFFFQDGKPIFRMQLSMLNPQSLYQASLLHTIDLLEKDFGAQIPFFSTRNLAPHHNIDAYLKSDYEDCANHFEKEYEKTLSHKFRKADDIQRIGVAIWTVMKGHGLVKVVYASTKKPHRIDSLFATNTRRNYAKKIASMNPGLFCINDGELSTPQDRMRLKKYLHKRFPKRSQFEW